MRTHPAMRVLNLIVLGILILTAANPGGAAYANIDPENPSTGLIYNQDGFGYSGQIAPHPLGSVVEMKAYSNWPAGLNKGTFAFSGGVFDGQNVWMIPYQADGVLKIDKDSAAMSVYKDWPSGFVKTPPTGTIAFSSGVFDGQSIWMIPYSADRVIKVDKDTGVMTGYNNWPAGTTSIGITAFSGGVYDGHNIWLVPAAVNKVVKLDPTTGAMTGYDSWPTGFNGAGGFRGGLFDGRYVWLIPSSANQVVRLDPATGAMVGYSVWPGGFDKSKNSFSGGVLAGQYLWMFPASGNGTNETVKLKTSSGEMTAYSDWPSDLASASYYRRFSGGTFDGQSIWMAPSTQQGKTVLRIDKDSGAMTGYSDWPSSFVPSGTNMFSGGVFDGKRIWLVPMQATQVIVLQTKSYAVTYAAGAHGSISGDANQSVAHGESSTSVTAIADDGYQFVDWSDGNPQATRSDANITAALSVTANFIEQQGPTQVTLESAVADGVSRAATSTKIAFTFDKDIAGLTANDISIIDDTGSVVAGSLTGSGRNWSVALSSVVSEGNVKLSVNSPEGYVVEGLPATVAVYKAAVPAAGLTVTSTDPTGAVNDGKTKLEAAEIQPSGNKLMYRNFATDAVVVPNVGDTLTGYTDLPSGGLIAAANGDKIGVAEVDADGKVARYGSTTAVSANEPVVETPYVNPTAPVESSVEVLVNGKVENAGKATTTEVNGVKTMSISIDAAKLQAKLDAEGNGAIVMIPVKSESSVIVGELTGQMVKNMANRAATLELKTDKAIYTLPAQQINIDAMSAQFGADVKLEDIKIKITIAQTPASTSQVVENAATEGGFSLLVPSIDFTVTGTYNGKTIEVSKFNAYVARTIALPDGIDPDKITTGIVVDPDGTLRHVPTKITLIDGKYYAEIHSLTNSTYSIVWHPQTFADVETHWAKDAVNDMGSRFVINGVSDTTFSPNMSITRAEFAAIVVRGLGLKLGEVDNTFADVAADAWYASAVRAAVANGLIAGFEDGTFRPDAKITREQAMSVVAKAMKLTGLADKVGTVDVSAALAEFPDSASAGGWAKDSIALAAKAGLISGRSGGKLEPKADVTRAEVATLIERLLKQSDLI